MGQPQASLLPPLPYLVAPTDQLTLPNQASIASFINAHNSDDNIDWQVVGSFGEEWTKFASFSRAEIAQIGSEYFDLINDKMLNRKCYVLDVGCGTGRWTSYVCQKAGFVEAIEPSAAVYSAARLLANEPNVRITQATASYIPFADNSFDFVFSLGVLHHIPDTQTALADCVRKLKPGGWFLVYLYYDFENRGLAFRSLFKLSNGLRRIVSQLPRPIKHAICDMLAVLIYLPFVALATIIKRVFPKRQWYQKVPLSWYVGKTWRVIRNDALDRFGTALEQRFSREQIANMMQNAGLVHIQFSPNAPFWHAIGQKPAIGEV